uniref:C-type lectin domain-containing protein n=1 Tax=Sinocyclocheilus rhinocerous TaxID=307959 RepID=A0A673HQ48_9TELE
MLVKALVTLHVFFLNMNQYCQLAEPKLTNSIEQRYIYISFLYTWREAQRHCRLYYTDLVSVRNLDENNQIMGLIPTLGFAYIGLFKDDFAWSDGSTSSFRNWDLLQPDFLGECVALTDNKFWKTELCGKLKPFFCYRIIASEFHK